MNDRRTLCPSCGQSRGHHYQCPELDDAWYSDEDGPIAFPDIPREDDDDD